MKKLLLLFILLAVSCTPPETYSGPKVDPVNHTPTIIIDTPPPTVDYSNLPEWTLIPDANFENSLITQGIDDIADGRVLTSKVSRLTGLRLEHAGITNTTGIENFLSLEFLSLWDNPIKTVDVSHNVLLKILGLGETHLETVDLSKNTELVELDFQGNSDRNLDPTYPWGKTLGFTSLDFSHNLKLERIYLMSNRLTELDVTMLIRLQDLWLGSSVIHPGPNGGNYLKTLDLSKNERLQNLHVVGGTLESLDLACTNRYGGKGSVIGKVSTLYNPKLTKIKVYDLSAIKKYIVDSQVPGYWPKWRYEDFTELYE